MNGSKFYAIGEIASAHGGDPLEVIKILDEFSKKGFQYIKFQVFSLEKLVNIYDEENSPLKDIEISPLNWRKIFKYISDNKKSFCKINFIAEPYDLSSLSLCSEFKFFDSYKLPTSDLSNLKLLEKILKHTKNIYLGTGGSKFDEISKTVNFIKNNYKDININLIHGFQAYPTDIKDMDLWKISYLKKNFSLKVGFADHADASSQVLRYLPSCMAISYGADFIEKHITIKREEQKPDYYSSLNPNEVDEFLFAIQQAKKLTSKSEFFELSKNEVEYRQSMKKYACASINIKMGDRLTLENITFKRSNKGKFSLFELDYLLGKIINKDLEVGHTFLPEDLL